MSCEAHEAEGEGTRGPYEQRDLGSEWSGDQPPTEQGRHPGDGANEQPSPAVSLGLGAAGPAAPTDPTASAGEHGTLQASEDSFGLGRGHTGMAVPASPRAANVKPGYALGLGPCATPTSSLLGGRAGSERR